MSYTRILFRGTVAVGGTTAAAAVAFPYFEDWYWTKYDPERVFHGESNQHVKNTEKKNLVILGTGWVSVSVLNEIDRDRYNVRMISPRNYFLFTPLLPSVCAGTVTPDAVTVSARSLTSYKNLSYWQRVQFMMRGRLPDRVEYLYASATDVDPESQTVTCTSNSSESFKIPYDVLVIGTGATTNTFNTKGVKENAFFLKETGDAQAIRQKVLRNLEQASVPWITDEGRRRLLSFWIIGGGPTAVEFAAELQDFLHNDVVNPKHAQYHRCAGCPTVTLVQSNSDLLPGYPKVIRKFAQQHLEDIGIDIMTNARASQVSKDAITIFDKEAKKNTDYEYGTVVWATGVTPGPFAQAIISKIPQQRSFRSIKVDGNCKVLGTSNIFAVGDCADIDQDAELTVHLINIFDMTNIKFGGTRKDRLSIEGSKAFLETLNEKEDASVSPVVAKLLQELAEKLNKGSKGLSKADVIALLEKHTKRQRLLPPTAQVAHQQGAYLANVLNNPKPTSHGIDSFDHHESFQFKNKGQLVYVGGHMAALSVPATDDFDVSWNGTFTNIIWHAAYFGMLESSGSRLELIFDWLKRGIFGRSTILDAICSEDLEGEDREDTTARDKTGLSRKWF